MLKKMMALLVAISCAFGAWADVTGHLSGTDFSPLSAGSFVTGLDDNGESTGSTYWFTGDTSDFEGTIVTNSLGKKFLDFESNIANPLYRTISGCWGATNPVNFVTTPIGTGLFIDTTVQFTPYLVSENHPEPTKLSNDDKLIVWVRETEVDGDANITNLIVTAGYYDAFDGLSASNYVVSLSSAAVSELCSNTNRLTIKSYSCITDAPGGPAGFVVYLNKTALEYTADAFAAGSEILADLAATPASYYESGHHKLFPSLMGDLENYNKLSGVGYAGMGKIGDVIFDTYATDYPDFAADPINFRIVAGDGVESYYYNGVQYFADHADSVAPTVASVTISNVVYASGWEHKTGTWYNGTNVVDNAVGVGGDYGTFIFDNGTTLNLAGFQANYLVGETPYQTLFGGTVTEPVGAIAAAAGSGATFKLTKDTVINESGNVNIVVDTGDVLVIDLNGHTLRGSTGNDETFTIVNIGGSLTVTDSSVGQTGAVLGSIFNEGSNQLAIQSISASVTNKLEAGTFEIVEGADVGDAPSNTGISGGKFLDLGHVDGEDDFYLQNQLNDGFEVVSWDQIGGYWYATIGSSAVIPCDVTFSTNNVVVAEWSQVVNSGDALTAAKIPDVSGLTGSWDAPAPTAESVITSDTNFNFTVAAPVVTYAVTFSTNTVVVAEWTTNIVAGAALGDAIPDVSGLTGAWDVTPTAETVINEATNFNFTISYRLTYASDHGAVPDGVVYTASTPDFALAAAPDPGVVGIAFAGWVIGSVTNEAGATFVVADHLEDTTATAAWVAVVPPTYFPQSDIDPSSPYAGRDGTPAKPFVIRNLADLNAFKTYVEDGTFASSSFEVVSNITGVTDWVGVGTDSTMFSGTLNGGGKTIDVTFAAGTKYNGLFRFVNNATISNLTVNVTAGAVEGETGGAAFVGRAYGSCTFETLKATGSLGTELVPVSHNAAGICCDLEGATTGNMYFNYCTNAMAIYGSYTKMGGILAFNNGWKGDNRLNYCVNLGNLSNISTATGIDRGTGGLMGWSGQYGALYITGCTNLGTITANIRPANFVADLHLTPTVTGVNVGLASLNPTDSTAGTKTTAYDWATVDGDIATFVTPVASVDSVVAYKVMQANSSPNFTLADPDAALTIDSSLAAYSGTVSVDSTLSADYDLRETAILNGTIYSLVSKTPAGTVIYLTMGSGVDSLSTSSNGTDWVAYTEALQDVELGSTLYIKGTSSVAGYEVPQFSIVVDDTHATEQTALVVNKSAIVYFPQTSIEQEWADRNGTAALPFVIRNYADLVALKNGVANGTITNQCFEQVANIDMDGEEPWAGIGTFECRTAGSGAFEGTYDGGNYAISNVTFDQHEYNGIFASVVGGVIKNLTVDVDGFAATSAFGGAAIAGVAKNCFLTNLVATGTIIGQSSTPCTHSAAGIAVRMEGTVAYACTNRCEIWSGKGKLGGIAAMGQGDRADSLILCSNEGDIHGTKTGGLGDGGVGGIFGYQGYGDGYQAVTYTNCRNIGQVTSLSSDKTGSILGHHSNSGPTFVGTTVTRDGMVVSGYGQDGVTYGKSIGGGLVELCTAVAFETNNTYSTLWSGLTPSFEFSAPGTISFNTNLFAATAFAITATGDLDVDSTEAGGIVTFTASVPSPADPWAPDYQTDESASNKVVEIFGEGSDVANHVNTLAEYGALVAYITNVTSEATTPDDLSGAQKSWMWKSFILGANPLFDADVAVEITSLTANSEAGKWDFTVKVTEGESTDAYNVAADKVAALVKIRTSLTTGTWVTPTAGNIEAIKLLGGNLIKVTVNFGDGASGFMKVSE